MNAQPSRSFEEVQDEFILLFLTWLQKNFVPIGLDEFRDIKDAPIPNKTLTLWKTADCLELYRKTQIPAKVSLPAKFSDKMLELAEIATHRSAALFSGYHTLYRYLQTASHISKEEINKIIADTMDQIS